MNATNKNGGHIDVQLNGKKIIIPSARFQIKFESERHSKQTKISISKKVYMRSSYCRNFTEQFIE